ncbi:MAG: hypothetical protein ABII72_05155, partial [Parcubacteria group bacterium]
MTADRENPMEEIAAQEAEEDPRLEGAVAEWKSYKKTRTQDRMRDFKTNNPDGWVYRFGEVDKEGNVDGREFEHVRDRELQWALRDDNHEYVDEMLAYYEEHYPEKKIDLGKTIGKAIYWKLFEEVFLKHDPYNSEKCPAPLDESNFDSLDNFAEKKGINIDWQNELQDILNTNGLSHTVYNARADLFRTKKTSGQPDMVERIQQLAQQKGVEVATNTPEAKQKFAEYLNRDIEHQIRDTMEVVLNSQESSRGFTGAEYLKSLTGSYAKINEKHQVGADFKDALERQTAFCHSLIET